MRHIIIVRMTKKPIYNNLLEKVLVWDSDLGKARFDRGPDPGK